MSPLRTEFRLQDMVQYNSRNRPLFLVSDEKIIFYIFVFNENIIIYIFVSNENIIFYIFARYSRNQGR